MGSLPVAGLPRFLFGLSFIDFFIFLDYHKIETMGSRELPTASHSNH
jgi:hypothetical protein